MRQHDRRLATLEKQSGLSNSRQGTVEVHAIGGSASPGYTVCDRSDEHGPACAYKVVWRNQSGMRFMRLYGFDPAALD
jgi:hypothetical protein